MIAKCSPISHGATAMDYNNKKEMAEIVCFHGMPADTDVDNVWSRMMLFQMMKRQELCAWKPIKNTALRFEVSPENIYTENWTLADWQKLAETFLKEVDNICERPQKDGKQRCKLKPLNLANSQYAVALHHDSSSGICHLHILVNRVDMDGHTNDAKFIGERAVEAANRISKRYGWRMAEDGRKANIEKLHVDAISVLRAMPSFSWPLFIQRMTDLGYGVQTKSDSKGNIRGMSFKMGHSVYKASELGHGRDLMPSKIETTCQKLHMADKQRQSEPVKKITETSVSNPYSSNDTLRPAIEHPQTHINQYKVDFGGRIYDIPISEAVHEQLMPLVKESVEDAASQTAEELLNVAHVGMLLFAGYVDAATEMSESVGGGGSPGGGWGKNEDEDDLKWLRRCVQKAAWLCKPMGRTLRR